MQKQMKQTMQLEVPQQLAMLCELLGTTPCEVIQGFINDVSLQVGSNGSDERSMAVEYFMRVGYGMPAYEFEQVQRMFDELDALRYAYRASDTHYAADRRKFLKEWYQQWKAVKKV